MPALLVVASRGAAVAVGLVRVLVGVLVVLLHQRGVVPAVLRARREAVAVFPCPLVVVVLVGGHQAAALHRRVVRRRVVAVAVSLGLRERRELLCMRFCFGRFGRINVRNLDGHKDGDTCKYDNQCFDNVVILLVSWFLLL